MEDYFGPAKKLMSDAKLFVDSLKSYDKDNIPPAIMKVIRDKYKPMENFTFKTVDAYKAYQAIMAARAGVVSTLVKSPTPLESRERSRC